MLVIHINSSVTWPKWEEIVYKNQGTTITICEYCDHSFWWNWNDTIINNAHQNIEYWPFTNIMLLLTYLFVFIAIPNTSLWYGFKSYAHVVVPVFQIIGLVVGSNAYFLTWCFIFFFTSKAKSLRNAQGLWNKWK